MTRPHGMPLDAAGLTRVIQAARAHPETGPVAPAPAQPAGPAKLSHKARVIGRLRRLLRRAYRLPGVGYGLFLVIGLLRLPRYLTQLQQTVGQLQATMGRLGWAEKHLESLAAEQQRVNGAVTAQAAQLESVKGQLGAAIDRAEQRGTTRLTDGLNQLSRELYQALERVQRDLAADLRQAVQDGETRAAESLKQSLDRIEADMLDVRRRLLAARGTGGTPGQALPAPAARSPVAEQESPATGGTEPESMDLFYLGLEDRFRGAATVKDRQRAHLPLVQEACRALPGLGVLDLGCGRGEWVALLAESGITARGIDLNRVAVAEAQAQGLAVEHGEAVAVLAATPQHSLAAITAFHLIEHLPLETLLALLAAARQALAPGGVLLCETPNPDNLIVASRNFWLDPTHERPIPPELAAYLLTAQGFARVETRGLHPPPAPSLTSTEPAVQELHKRLYGPQDYGVIGWA